MIRKDLVPNTNYVIFQKESFFAYSMDSLLLLRFSKAKGVVADLGCGTGILSMGLVDRGNISRIYSVDIQEEVLDLFKMSLEENRLEEKIIPIYSDIEIFANNYKKQFNSVLMNPPYFERDIENQVENHRISRHHSGMEPWIRAASKLLPTKGTLELVYRPERLARLFELMRKHRMEPKEIQFVRSSVDSLAKSVLIRGARDGGIGLKVLPDIIV